jgi:protein TonB
MPEGAFFEQKRLSPTSLGIVIALHGAALTALLLAKNEIIVTRSSIPDVFLIPDKKDPPPEPERPMPDKPLPKQQVTYIKPVVEPKLQQPTDLTYVERPVVVPPTFDPPPQPRFDPPAPPPVEKAEPVRTGPVMRPGVERQPPYPASEQRAGVEGSVTVRLVIGADGRVKSVTKVSGTNDAFFRATERQALRHWRFKPAMIDGKPVESSQTVTVQFQMMG